MSIQVSNFCSSEEGDGPGKLVEVPHDVTVALNHQSITMDADNALALADKLISAANRTLRGQPLTSNEVSIGVNWLEKWEGRRSKLYVSAYGGLGSQHLFDEEACLAVTSHGGKHNYPDKQPVSEDAVDRREQRKAEPPFQEIFQGLREGIKNGDSWQIAAHLTDLLLVDSSAEEKTRYYSKIHSLLPSGTRRTMENSE